MQIKCFISYYYLLAQRGSYIIGKTELVDPVPRRHCLFLNVLDLIFR